MNKKDGANPRYESENIHHIVPRSRGGTNESDNKIKLYISLHDALHRLYGNATPTEQIRQLLLINATALTKDFCSDVMNLLQEDDDQYYYKNGILRK